MINVKAVIVIMGFLMSIMTVGYSTTLNASSRSNCCIDKKHICCQPSHYFYPSCKERELGIFLKADFLYWNTQLCGLLGAFGDTSIITTDSGGGFLVTNISESHEQPNFKWKPGFRVGIEFLMHCFDIDLFYTHSNGKATFSKGSQNGNWNLEYDAIDLLFGYKFYPCRRFLIKPFIGARGLKIHQGLNSRLETLQINDSGRSILITDITDREKFWGIGPEVGVEANWYIGYNFSIYITIDAINYYGRVRGRYLDTDCFPTIWNVDDLTKRYCFNTFATDGSVGIRWDKYTYKNGRCDPNMHYYLKLGLEQHRIYDFSNLGSDGTLSMDGLIAGAGIEFIF